MRFLDLSMNLSFAACARSVVMGTARILLVSWMLPACLYPQSQSSTAPTPRAESRAPLSAGCCFWSLNRGCPSSTKPQELSLLRDFARSSPSRLARSSTIGCHTFAPAKTEGGVAICGTERSWGGARHATEFSGLTDWNQNQSSSPPVNSPAGKDSPGHIFWVVPAYKVDYLKNITPLTPREKFDLWARGAYDPWGLGIRAGEALLEHSPHSGFCGYGNGIEGYGKCYGSALVDSNISSFFGDFVFPVVLHQDPRYFRLGEGSTGKRIVYAVSRVFLTRTDSGSTSVDTSALAGTILAAAASNLYYPRQDRGFGLTLSRVGWDLGNTALFNLAAEFWPDVKLKIKRTF